MAAPKGLLYVFRDNPSRQILILRKSLDHPLMAGGQCGCCFLLHREYTTTCRYASGTVSQSMSVLMMKIRQRFCMWHVGCHGGHLLYTLSDGQGSSYAPVRLPRGAGCMSS